MANVPRNSLKGGQQNNGWAFNLRGLEITKKIIFKKEQNIFEIYVKYNKIF